MDSKTATLFKKNSNILKASDLYSHGIRQREVDRMLHDNEIIRVKRGY